MLCDIALQGKNYLIQPFVAMEINSVCVAKNFILLGLIYSYYYFRLFSMIPEQSDQVLT